MFLFCVVLQHYNLPLMAHPLKKSSMLLKFKWNSVTVEHFYFMHCGCANAYTLGSCFQTQFSQGQSWQGSMSANITQAMTTVKGRLSVRYIRDTSTAVVNSGWLLQGSNQHLQFTGQSLSNQYSTQLLSDPWPASPSLIRERSSEAGWSPGLEL